MLVRKSQSNKLYQRAQIVRYRRRLRRVLINAAARFLELNPQWHEYFFDLSFLLNRGLPIIEEYLAGTASNSAMDLALAWAAEEWPSMTMSQRKVCLQAQTVIAAELLKLATPAMLLCRPVTQDAIQEHNGRGRGIGMPLAYVQAQNPPGYSMVRQRQPLDAVRDLGLG